MKWLIENWFKANPFLAIYLTLLLVLFVMGNDFALFLLWLQLPVYFAHEFEEYILPGGFTRFFNHKMLGSNDDAWPLDPTWSFWINGSVVFLAFPIFLTLSSVIDVSLGLWCAYFSFVNAFSHVVMVFRHGYNPGCVVSLVLNIPVAIYTIWYFAANAIVGLDVQVMSALVALLIQGIVMVLGFRVLKPRVARKQHENAVSAR
ncbi:MAG: HXXEE domain-containing protein [Coriobacteriales bacterium]|jgi:hypothetical protein